MFCVNCHSLDVLTFVIYSNLWPVFYENKTDDASPCYCLRGFSDFEWQALEIKHCVSLYPYIGIIFYALCFLILMNFYVVISLFEK